jgi:hypothetical protein
MASDAHTNPVATTAAATTKIAISNRVSVQSLRMVRLNGWTISEQIVLEKLTDSLRACSALSGQLGGDKWALRSFLALCNPSATAPDYTPPPYLQQSSGI